MNRKHHLTLRMKAKELSFNTLTKGIVQYTALTRMNPNDPRTMTRIRELSMFRYELHQRGFRMNKIPMPFGYIFELVPNDPILLAMPDHKAMGDVTMTIPSVDSIINGPTALDLPAHGYLAHR